MVDVIRKTINRWLIKRFAKRKVKEIRKDRIYVFIDGKGRMVTLPYTEDNMHLAAHGMKLRRDYFKGKFYEIPAHELPRAKLKVDALITSKQLVGIVEGVVELQPN